MKHFIRGKVWLAVLLSMGCLLACGKTDPEQEEAAEQEITMMEDAAEQEETEMQAQEELTAQEAAKLMGNGINLGNTLEAYGHADLGVMADVSAYETYWGQPETTQEMINGMKESGFDSIRIPIAWTNAMEFENGDYTIQEAYLERVEEMIHFAKEASMYVIINDHWDGGWWGMFGSSKAEDREAAMEMYISMWTQIAERYKDDSDYLIFESGNEELGDRLNDIDICKDSGSLSEDECYQMVNEINQTFVDTIRSTGGNNAKRFLLIAGYNTDIEKTCDERFIMPTDSAEGKLFVSVHYYTPWSYCGTASTEQWGTAEDYEQQNTLLEKMSKFTKQGYGVIIGEYAVIPAEQGTIKANTIEYVNNFLDNCDLYGYVPMLWDCSNFYLRKDLKFVDEELEKVYQNRNAEAQSRLSEEQIQAEAKANIEAALLSAPETFQADTAENSDEAVAWIMFNSQDWVVTYSAGDIYHPDSITAGVIAADAAITGAGTYTVSLDFRGTEAGAATGTAFCALAVANGEILYPGYVMDIKEILINGEVYELTEIPYTTSDDGKCTRVNLYNEWVDTVPDGARTLSHTAEGASAVVLDQQTLGNIETIEITFDYAAP